MIVRDHSNFGAPAAARFFLEEDAGGGTGGNGGGESSGAPAGGDPDGGGGDGGALDDFSATDPHREPAPKAGERVEGEKPPDFGALFGKKTAEKPPAGETPPKAPAKAEKPAGEAPAKPAAPSGKAAAPAKPALKGETPPKKAADAPKPGEKPPGEAAPKEADKKEAKIPTDAEIDALQPKADAPRKVIEDFGKMRASMKTLAQQAREAATARETLQKEVETLKASTGKLPDDVTKELEGLRQFHLLFNAQQDPLFKQEYDSKIETATTGIYDLLKMHGLSDEILKQIQDTATANGGNPEAWPHWQRLLNSFKNPVDRQTALNALQARRDAIKTRETKLAQLQTDREGYHKSLAERQQGEQKQWAKNLETHALEISSGAEWAIEKDYPENASDEVKAAIDKHNAEVKTVAEQFKTNVLGAWNRDPKVTAELAFAGVKAAQLEKQVDVIESAKAKAEARVKELESQIAKIKASGRLAHSDSPAGGETASARPKTTVEEGKIGGDGSSAIKTFFAGRGQ